MADDFGIGRSRIASSTPIGSPMFPSSMDNMIAQSYRSNQFRPPSPASRPQQSRSSDEPPLLKRHKVEFTPDEPITQLAAGHNQVAIATKNKKILIIDTRSSKQTYCDIARYLGARIAQAKVHKLFLDPTGKFVLISLAFASDNQPLENLLYVKQIQPLPRLKNHLISAVAWNYPKASSSQTSNNLNNSNSTGTILVGTTRGLILQTEFIHSDESKFFPLTPGPRQYVREVFDVGHEAGAITGLEYHQIPSGSQSERTFVILVSTNSRLYRIIGSVPANVDPPPLHQIFAQNSTNYKDVPGKLAHSNLDLYYPISPTNSPPIRFAWLTEPGIMTSEIFNQLTQCKSSFDSNEDINLIPYTNPDEPATITLSASTPSGMSPPFSAMPIYYYDKPISIVVSNFHVTILFRHCIRTVSILNNLVVYEEYFSPNFGNTQGMSKDPIKNIIWVYFRRAIFRYKILNESKNVWKIYLDQKRFDLARKYGSGDESNFDRVICEEAQHYFKIREYEKSAEIFARSKKPFEDVSLMFMEVNCSRALKKYLMIRLEKFEHDQTIQLTMTIAWLLEIIISSISVAQTEPESERNVAELDELSVELGQLFESKQVVECMKQHSNLFYGIIRNYSNWDTLIRVAKLIGDYEHVVQCYMDLGEFEKSLEVMKLVKKNDLFYTYGHILMKRLPKQLVDALMEQSSIAPSKLISILIQENPYFNKCSETIRYLEYCVRVLRTDCKVIHNYLFELYARHRDESTLMEYLEQEIPTDGSQKYYLDLQLCLRLCTELKLVKTCVVLYSNMGLHDEAVHLALSFDIELAKEIAKQVESDDHQKRLWLSIAENALTRKADIQIATGLLRECRLLKIEDILPFFPDNTTIDYFKDAIRQSLQEYRNQIISLKDGTYDNIADEIRNEIKTFRNRYSIIKVGQKCEVCSRHIMSRTFYVFPCGHLFHSDCMIKAIIEIDPQYKGIEDKLKQLAMDTSSKFGTSLQQTRQQSLVLNSNSSSSQGRLAGLTSNFDTKERIVAELDSIISSECIYCGSLFASCIDMPAPVRVDLYD